MRSRAAAMLSMHPEQVSARCLNVGGDEDVLFEVTPTRIELPGTLSAAETEVATLTLRGYSKRDVARTRGASVNTVANQLRAVYRKLGVSSRTELIQLVLRELGSS